MIYIENEERDLVHLTICPTLNNLTKLSTHIEVLALLHKTRVMADRVKEVAVEEAERIKNLAADAARSGAYLYPLRVCDFLGYYVAGD